MADDVNVTPGVGATLGADEISSVKYPRIKLIHGADGVNAGDVSTANGLPVQLQSGQTLGTVTTVSTVTNLSQLGGANVPIGAGLEATAVRVTLPTDGTGVVKLGAGTAGIGKLTANSGVDIGDVDVTSCALPTGASTLAEQQTQTASLSVMDDWDNAASDGASVSGDVAHDSADAGEPVKVGAKAIAALSGTTLVAAADRTNNQSDLDGALIVRNNFALGDLVNGNASNTDGTSTQVLAAGAAGVKHYITDVTITNTSASNIYVELKDNTTVKWTFPVPANGGVTHHFASPLGGTAATAWNFDPSAAATTIYCSVSGFKSKI